MSDNRTPGGNIIAPLLCFVFTAAVAVMLLIGAFVMWLAALTGSVAVAALITGGFFTLLSAVIYLLAVRSAVDQIRDRLDTIYEVAARVREGYAWLAERFSFLSFLRKSR